jgi:hypothetical protein
MTKQTTSGTEMDKREQLQKHSNSFLELVIHLIPQISSGQDKKGSALN